MAETTRAIRHERTDIHIRRVAAAAAMIAGGVVLAAAIAWLVSGRGGADRNGANGAAPAAIEAPRLQSEPRAELAAFLREKRERLDGYGWVDAPTGRVHIPIDRAMRLLAERAAKGERK
jgi:hypothetical protein